MCVARSGAVEKEYYSASPISEICVTRSGVVGKLHAASPGNMNIRVARGRLVREYDDSAIEETVGGNLKPAVPYDACTAYRQYRVRVDRDAVGIDKRNAIDFRILRYRGADVGKSERCNIRRTVRNSRWRPVFSRVPVARRWVEIPLGAARVCDDWKDKQ